MRASQISIPKPSSSSPRALARERLHEFLEDRRRAKGPVEDLEQFEAELHALFAAAEAEAVADELARFDVDLPSVEIDGVSHRRVLRCEETYMTAAGPVRVMRTLYSTRQDGERAIPAMEVRAGMIGGFWTPLAAKQATWVVAHLTPQEGEDLFGRLGGMKPSKSRCRDPAHPAGQIRKCGDEDGRSLSVVLRVGVESITPTRKAGECAVFG